MLVSNGLKKIIEDNHIEFDYIAGIPTAGIAPAASLAQLMNKPLIIYDNNKFIKASNFMDIQKANNSEFEIYNNKNLDAIASTCPYSIPAGIEIANSIKTPFVYVRQNKKDHGMERKIEGMLLENQKVLLLDLYLSSQESYGVSAGDSIFEITKKKVKIFKEAIMEQSVDVSGKKLLVLEDLISTGSSSIKEIIEYRKQGAIVENLLSIFNYGFPEVNKNFEDAKINVNSALYYDTMLKVAKENDYITMNQQELLSSWRIEPFKWGEKNGFPKDSMPLK
jgi:orotate phosphoribosyltransferase